MHAGGGPGRAVQAQPLGGGATAKSVIDAIGENLPIAGPGIHKLLHPAAARALGIRGRRRRTNPANIRALRRASSRIKSAEKMYKKIFTMHHGGHAGSVRLKHGRKR